MSGALALGLAISLISLRPVVNQPFSPAVAALLFGSAVLLLLALPGMYAAQADATGTLGLVGHALLMTGLLLPVVIAATPLLHPSIMKASGENAVVFGLGIALTLGLLLTAIATLQADVFPRAAAVLLLAATAGFFFVFFIAEFLPPAAGQVGSASFGILLAAGLAWIGLALWLRN
ncbi:MAG TPA: hypothetical protein VFK35_12570 [Candidatus Limnocylindrales bacterium]|nr:hypothetical protein [Candidatus Limnocylindrales bacterium]